LAIVRLVLQSLCKVLLGTYDFNMLQVPVDSPFPG
jgi:hypothetical protein